MGSPFLWPMIGWLLFGPNHEKLSCLEAPAAAPRCAPDPSFQLSPFSVCVFRDVVASTWRGVVRRRQEPLNLMRRALDLQSSNLRLIEKSKLPTLLVSYEKAIADPLQLVASLNRFMSLGLSPDQLAAHAEKVNPELGYNASIVR